MRVGGPSIGLVDYGMGNRRSAEKALERVGARVEVSGDPERLRMMDGLVLPGVGAFPAAMAAIRAGGLDELLEERVEAGVPLLGLCLGMQLLFDSSEEHGGATGLGLLAGGVRRLSAPGCKLPHIGWSELRWLRPTPLSEGLPDPAYLYHVHSFAPWPADEDVVLATADYGE
jgi:glutamine amidotransferase